MRHLSCFALLLSLLLLPACIGDPNNPRAASAERFVRIDPGDEPRTFWVRVDADEDAASTATRWLATVELFADPDDIDVVIRDRETGAEQRITYFGSYPQESHALGFECGSPCERELGVTIAPRESLTEPYEGPLRVHLETHNEVFSGDFEGRFELDFID